MGYKRPPPEHRFQSGQSGNPHGRPKGRHSNRKKIASILNELLNRKIRVSENGEDQTIPVREALVKRVMKSASEGNALGLKIFLEYICQSNDENVLYTVESDWGFFSTENYDEVVEAFERANEYRRQNSMPELDLDEVMEANKPRPKS